MAKAFEEEKWTDDNGDEWTRESFFEKMDWEGGVGGLLSWGGPSVFPPSLRESATQVKAFFDLIDSDDLDENVD